MKFFKNRCRRGVALTSRTVLALQGPAGHAGPDWTFPFWRLFVFTFHGFAPGPVTNRSRDDYGHPGLWRWVVEAFVLGWGFEVQVSPRTYGDLRKGLEYEITFTAWWPNVRKYLRQWRLRAVRKAAA